VKPVEPGKIDIAFVNNVKASHFIRDEVKDVHIVHTGCSDVLGSLG
jgi:hypothetical protein